MNEYLFLFLDREKNVLMQRTYNFYDLIDANMYADELFSNSIINDLKKIEVKRIGKLNLSTKLDLSKK